MQRTFFVFSGIALSSKHSISSSEISQKREAASTIRHSNSSTLQNSNYLSLMLYGVTDKSVSENEVIRARIVETGEPTNKMLNLEALEHSHKDWIVSGMKSSFSKVAMKKDEWERKTVGFCTDGATVNMGPRNGVVAKLRADIPHLIDFHCMVHRLKLALLELKKVCPMVEDISACLLLVWKTSLQPQNQAGVTYYWSRTGCQNLQPSTN